MSQYPEHEIALIGPCGFYCGTCRQYLAKAKNKLKEKKLKDGCLGCRMQDKKCSWVKKDCELLQKKQVDFCFECKEFPCENLKQLDKRHVQDDNISVIGNLERIQKLGVKRWLAEQKARWNCPACGGNVCVIDRQCYDCGEKTDQHQGTGNRMWMK